MDSFLKTIRAIHLALVASGSICILTTISMWSQGDLLAAHNELAAFHNTLSRLHADKQEMALFDNGELTFTAIDHDPVVVDVEQQLRVRLDNELGVSFSQELRPSAYLAPHAASPATTPSLGATLDEIRARLQTPIAYGVFLPNPGDVSDYIAALLSDLNTGEPTKWTVEFSDCYRKSDDGKQSSFDIPLHDGAQAAYGHVAFTLRGELAAGHREGSEPPTLEHNDSMHVRGGWYIVETSTENALLKRLASQHGALNHQSPFFDAVYMVWVSHNLGSKNINTAVVDLKKDIDDAVNAVSAFGIRFHKRILLIAFPLVHMLALLYLLAYFRLARRLGPAPPNIPWLPLHKGWLVSGLSIAIGLFIPATGPSWLWLGIPRSNPFNAEGITSLVLALGSIVLAIICVRELRLLRKTIG